MSQGHVPVSDDLRALMTHLVMLRELHNAAHPDAPIYQADLAEFIGLKSKSTMGNYESGYSVPRLAILSKWLEFWGYKLVAVRMEDLEDEHQSGGADQVVGSGEAAD